MTAAAAAARPGLAARATTLLGLAALIALTLTAWMGLVGTPPDVNQGDAVRLIYVHVPAAVVAMYFSFGVTSLASALYLLPRTRSLFWDRLAAASAETGVLFTALTLATGSIWGRPIWGVWWTWDARLTTTAVMLVLYLGYLALRRLPAAPEVRARRAAIAGLAAFVDVPIVHKSVEWWRTLHQPATLFDEHRLLDPAIHGSMLWTLVLGFVAFTLLYAWLVVRRVRLARLEERRDEVLLGLAMAERRAEGHQLAELPT